MGFNGFQQLSFLSENCEVWYWYKTGYGNKYIIMLHGAGCDHIMFEKQIDIFDDSYNIIVWDARGHGLSKIERSQEFNFKDMYNDCLKLFEIYHIKNAILIGQSMGGNLAQEIAYYRPEIVSMLVLLDCTKNTQKLTFIEKMTIKMSPIIFNCYPWRMLIYQSADACGNTEYVKNYVKKCFEKIEKRKFIEIMMSLFTCLHEDNEYQFKQPTLLICGFDDKSGNIKKAMTMWSKNDNKCRLQMIKNAGHNSNQDNPEDVNKCILTFINERFQTK
jgi:pimeloyl-ACP methyl ester carboxylesterase